MRSHLLIKQFIFLAFTFISAPSFASNEIREIQGLILDRTITLSGNSFYKKFSAHWLVTNFSQPYNLIVTESPSARWGNLISISSRNKVLYKTSMRPGKLFNNSRIKEAASSVSQNMLNHFLSKKSSHDMTSSGY